MKSFDHPRELAAFIRKESHVLLTNWRERVCQLPSARELDKPNLNDHIPLLLDEIATLLESHDGTASELQRCDASPPEHGRRRLENGFKIDEVVSEYNILRGCIHALAELHGYFITGQTFHFLNRAFDDAIGLAVRTFAEQQAAEIRRRREDYLAFVAHDLRTPLGAISLTVDLLDQSLLHGNGNATSAKALHSLRRNVGHLNTLVGRVLEENANLQTELGVLLECRYFDLWPLVESLRHDMQASAEQADTTIANEVPDDLMVYADAGLLRRVLQNLLVNALRYTPKGTVKISARYDAKEQGVVCTVSDNGAGIAPERLKLIFERFETDGEGTSGHGLGLAICKAFVEAHGGTISVRSQISAGSIFEFSLPHLHRLTESQERHSVPN